MAEDREAQQEVVPTKEIAGSKMKRKSRVRIKCLIKLKKKKSAEQKPV